MGAKTYKKAIQSGLRCKIYKSDDDKRQVFGWASVSARADGDAIVDFQDDIIEADELEKAAYEFVLENRGAGEMHERSGVGKLIESVMFTKEKMAAMGVPEGVLPTGWWIGFHIPDDSVWQKIKSGEYSSFSIEGTGQREPIIAEG